MRVQANKRTYPNLDSRRKENNETWPHLRRIIYARYWITLKIILYIVQNLKMAKAILDMWIFKREIKYNTR